MKIIIDRFEGNFAVVELEEGKIVNMPKLLVPKDAKEGDVVNISIDKYETEKRKNKIEIIKKELWEN